MSFMVGLVEGVEWAGAIASKNHGPGKKILHRKTIWIKFNGTRVIGSKLTDGDKIFDYLWNNEDITKM